MILNGNKNANLCLFSGKIQDVVVPKETWIFLKPNFHSYRHSEGLCTKIKFVSLTGIHKYIA